jgi:hypothetical protein
MQTQRTAFVSPFYQILHPVRRAYMYAMPMFVFFM